jgi:signal transduction histidine kinase
MRPVIRDEVYRIGYEAIRIACAHSHGSQVNVRLSYYEDLMLRVIDDGVGIDPTVLDQGKKGHYGLPGMRERAARIAGKLSITSSKDSGTEVKLAVPGRIIFRDPIAAPFKRLTAIFSGKGEVQNLD